MGCDGAVVGSWERRMGVRERERRADWCDEVSTFLHNFGHLFVLSY